MGGQQRHAPAVSMRTDVSSRGPQAGGRTMRTACVAAVLLAAVCFGVPAGAGTAHPRVAIVFEHAGVSLDDLQPIYAMHRPFGLGIFPHQRYSARIVRDAAAHGLTPMLHLPLESIR